MEKNKQKKQQKKKQKHPICRPSPLLLFMSDKGHVGAPWFLQTAMKPPLGRSASRSSDDCGGGGGGSYLPVYFSPCVPVAILLRQTTYKQMEPEVCLLSSSFFSHLFIRFLQEGDLRRQGGALRLRCNSLLHQVRLKRDGG